MYSKGPPRRRRPILTFRERCRYAIIRVKMADNYIVDDEGAKPQHNV
jgi:hypothetical protein